jgi:hypothetical protein
MAGMRVAYIQTHITNVQHTSARTGVRNSAVVGMLLLRGGGARA